MGTLVPNASIALSVYRNYYLYEQEEASNVLSFISLVMLSFCEQRCLNLKQTTGREFFLNELDIRKGNEDAVCFVNNMTPQSETTAWIL